MKPCIILGAGLDGAPAPLGLPPFTAAVGPLGFADLLGQWLGLASGTIPESERIATTMAALATLPDRFWSRSFTADPWATARRVLALRDALVMAGWDGNTDGAPPRIVDLAALPPLPAGLPDFLHGLVQELATRIPPSLPRVKLLEPLSLWPPLWRAILTPLAPDICDPPLVQAEGDLGALQNWFAIGKGGGWRGDGSLTLLTGDAAGCADIVSALLPALPPGSALLGADAGALPLLLRARHQPRATPLTGPPLGAQLLSLALAQHWAPFDAEAALEFLQLPDHPLGGSTRFLIDAISAHPGHGGALYRAAVDKAREKKLAADAERGVPMEARETAAQARMDAIAAWLPATRFTAVQGLPAAVLMQVCERVIKWAGQRQRPEDAGPASTLQRAAACSGLAVFSPGLLGRMLESVTAGNITVALPEAAPWRGFNNPAARLDATQATLWWLGPAQTQAAPPWRMAERGWMRAHGLEPDETLAPQRARLAMARTIGLTARLILINPRGGEETAQPHSLLGLLTGCFGASLQNAWTEAQNLQSGGTLAGFNLSVETLPLTSPPPPQRDWLVPKGLLQARPEESPSGLEKLLGCPLAWVFNYHAKLRPRGPASLPGISQLTGTLLHEVMHQVFANGYANPTDAAAKAQSLFDRLVPEMAAPLLQPQAALAAGRARVRIGQAMAHLTAELAGAKLRLTGAEQALSRALPGKAGMLTGRYDLMFSGPQGDLVLDAKWTSSAKYYESRLAGNTALQLAAYAWLAGGNTSAAYYLLRQRRLLAADAYPFADAQVPDADLAACFQAALEDYAAALKELKAGRIVAAGIDPPESDERGLAIDPPCRFCDYSTLCGAGA